MIDQAWTIVALAIGYIVLEGTARELTGWLIISTIFFWIATFPLRYDKD